MLDVSNNHLSQIIPRWIGKISSIDYSDLSRNNFSGSLTPIYDTYDMFICLEINLSHTNLTGRVPKWIDRLSNLKFLLLSDNNLESEIPTQLYRLDRLTLIDLSHNHLSYNSLSCILYISIFLLFAYTTALEYSQQSFEGNNTRYFTGTDFSCNNFTRKIPIEIGNLSKIKEIESLDLSYNKLEGEIPSQLIRLYSLVVFNVAHNNLFGKTPIRIAQFATFKESSFKDNLFLCRQPFSKVCYTDMPPSPMPTSMNNEGNGGFMDMEVFYVSFGVAYIMVGNSALKFILETSLFHFIEVSITNCYYFMVDNLPILSKFIAMYLNDTRT
uniref:Uncharacterized protein n=1 Tax=Salix viminalis TaxID=40686 RepID=A0A6N2K488_SALVM